MVSDQQGEIAMGDPAMKRILLNTHRLVAAFAVLIVLAVTTVSAVIQTASQNQATAAQEAAENEAFFWRVVAGEDSGGPTVDVQLARDLRGLSASEVQAFQGNSNRYGGITDAIGYDPFDETGLNCFECGPLDPYTKDNLALIRAGQLDQVLAGTEVPAPEEGLTLTPFGMSMVSYLLILWIIGGPITLAIAHYSAKFTNERYAAVRRFDDLWGEDESVDRGQVLLAPSFFLPYLAYRSLTHRRFQERVRDAFPDQMQAIDHFDRALERAPVDAGTWQLLREKRNDAVRELESQTRSGEGTDDEVNALMRQILDVQGYLEARLEAKKELQ